MLGARLVKSGLAIGVAAASVPLMIGAQSASASGCPAGTAVATATQLKAALAAAKPGGVIVMSPGTYLGKFAITVSGTAALPITLCGPQTAIIDGGTNSHTFSLVGASWWQLTGFQIQHGLKGLDLSHSSNNVVTGLYVHDTKDAGVHVNSFSTYNTFNGLLIRHVAAEAFYIGSARTNWCMYSGCLPDASDHNTIENSDIAGTISDPIDLKEGSSFGTVSNNRIDGTGMTAKSWINIKGNGYLVTGNVGTNSPRDGYDVHQILVGWGNNNVLSLNQATVNGPGYAYYVQPGTVGNHVLCNNTFTAAALGFGNIACG